MRGFKMMGCLAISICMGIISLFLVKCRQGLATVLKNAYCFVSVSFFYLVDLRICVCLKIKPWSDSSITFNQYIINWYVRYVMVCDTFNRYIIYTLVGFNNSLIEYLCLKYLPHRSNAKLNKLSWEVFFVCV